jgi:hypothetical protein
MLTDIEITKLLNTLYDAELAIAQMRLYINNPHRALFGKPELAIYLAKVEEAAASLEDANNVLQIEYENVLREFRKANL